LQSPADRAAGFQRTHVAVARFAQYMDCCAPDKTDENKLNEIFWRRVRGEHSPMPAPRRAAFYKAHAKDDDDDT
jgi:hypothetical protein